MDFEKLYFSMPYWLQYIFLNVKGYQVAKRRYNKSFHLALKTYHQSRRDVVDATSLKEFMVHAQKSLFWKERFASYKVDLDANDMVVELGKLPVLSKQEVKDNIERIKIRDIEESVITASTSGTTGSGLVFPKTYTMEVRQWAVWWRYRNQHGIDLKDTCAWFGGRSILDIDRKKPPFWIHNRFMNQTMFSAHHLNEKTVGHYFEKIKSQRIKWIHGYPSQITFFASLVEKSKLGTLANLQIVTFGAENLLEYQIKQIKRVFGNIKLVQHYGLAEGVSNISENSEGTLEADQDFAYTEFIKSDQSDSYKIIGTGYSNLAFPLIRYETGDLASLSHQGDKVIIESIDGRNEDYVVLPNGVKLGRLNFIFNSLENIDEAQIHQIALNTIKIRVVKGAGYTVADEKKLFFELTKRFGSEVIVDVVYCDKIERTASGKLKLVISEI